jgi:hypothetical protein
VGVADTVAVIAADVDALVLAFSVDDLSFEHATAPTIVNAAGPAAAPLA